MGENNCIVTLVEVPTALISKNQKGMQSFIDPKDYVCCIKDYYNSNCNYDINCNHHMNNTPATNNTDNNMSYPMQHEMECNCNHQCAALKREDQQKFILESNRKYDVTKSLRPLCHRGIKKKNTKNSSQKK